jgi:hypothetical protein
MARPGQRLHSNAVPGLPLQRTKPSGRWYRYLNELLEKGGAGEKFLEVPRGTLTAAVEENRKLFSRLVNHVRALNNIPRLVDTVIRVSRRLPCRGQKMHSSRATMTQQPAFEAPIVYMSVRSDVCKLMSTSEVPIQQSTTPIAKV